MNFPARTISSLRTSSREAGNDVLNELHRDIPSTATGAPGVYLGSYKLLQKLGEGDGGVVWMAQQDLPAPRRVALKVGKPDAGSESSFARLEAEHQALALMDHPNIAKVFDAVSTDQGRPFFAMELVRGIPIRRYCDQNGLDGHARRQLFRQVCLALQHAQQNGIFHRNLKPSNVLVTVQNGVPVAKVIDFGVAQVSPGQTADPWALDPTRLSGMLTDDLDGITLNATDQNPHDRGNSAVGGAASVPLISALTQARLAGYFRLGWKMAVQRTYAMAEATAFLLPMLVEPARETDEPVPGETESAPGTEMPGNENSQVAVGPVQKYRECSDRSRSRRSASQRESRAGELAENDEHDPVIPDYELVRIIGRGSYGDVWLARGLTGVYRAIKIVWRNRFPTAEPFDREFNGLKKFTSMARPDPGQMALLHIGRNEPAGFFYYVMELADDVYVGGEIDPATYAPLTLKEVRARGGRLPPAKCVSIGVELARALAGLHARGLVHRDIKPSNVILVGGAPKLADIGLVAATAEAFTYVGTEGFVPPEGPGKPTADVFALGRLLYELATGLDREEFPRLPREISELPDQRQLFELNEIILRAGDPDPRQRYANASALLADLQLLQQGKSVRQQNARGALPRIAAIAAVIALATAGAWVWWSHSATIW